MKATYVENYQPNERVADVFLVKQKELRTKKMGGEYLFAILADKTGQLTAFLWDHLDRYRNLFEVGDFIYVQGQTRDYNHTTQITINQIQKVPEDQVDLTDFIPRSDRDPELSFKELMTILQNEVTIPPLKQLLLNIFQAESIAKAFKNCPAAKALHHAYSGGLLDHTLSMVRLCQLISSHFPFLNRSLLLAGAALHDIGKIEELSWERVFDYTDVGRLLGHITTEALMVDRMSREIPHFPDMLRTQLIHLLLSHHRELEFGSPRQPMMVEALVLSYVDDLDAKVQAFREAALQPGDGGNWTPFNQHLQRYLFRKTYEWQPVQGEDDS